MPEPLALPLAQPSRDACCRPGACAFRPNRVRSYVLTFLIARMHRIDPADLLDAILRERSELNTLVQCASMPGSHGRLARDLMLSLELASSRTGIEIAPHNTTRLAEALCPFATEAAD